MRLGNIGALHDIVVSYDDSGEEENEMLEFWTKPELEYQRETGNDRQMLAAIYVDLSAHGYAAHQGRLRVELGDGHEPVSYTGGGDTVTLPKSHTPARAALKTMATELTKLVRVGADHSAHWTTATVEPAIKDKTGVTTQEPVDLAEALHSHLQTNHFGAVEHVGTINGRPVEGRLTTSHSAGWEFKYDGKSYALYPRTDGQFLFYEAQPDWAMFAKPVDKSRVRVFRSTEKSRHPVKLILKTLAEGFAWAREQHVVATVEPGQQRVTPADVDAIVRGYVETLLQHDHVQGEDEDNDYWSRGYRFNAVHSGIDKVKSGVLAWLKSSGVTASACRIIGKSRSHHSNRHTTWSWYIIGASLYLSVTGATAGFTEWATPESDDLAEVLEESVGFDTMRRAPQNAELNGHGGIELC